MKIENKEEHEIALSWITATMTSEELPASFFDIVVEAVEVYEKKHYPIPRPSPWRCRKCRKIQRGRLNARGDDVECTNCGSAKP